MKKSNKITIFSGEETTSAGFYVGPLAVLVELEFGDVGFWGGRKIGERGQNPRGRARTKLTHLGHRAWIDPGHISGREFSQLRHPWLLPKRVMSFELRRKPWTLRGISKELTNSPE